MNQQPLHDLVGTTVLSGFRLEALVHVDDAIAMYRASCTEGSVCTVRLCLMLEVEEHQEASLQAVFTRIARHAVGIRGLAPPRAAGMSIVEGRSRLVVVHAGDPTPSVEQRIENGTKTSLDEVLVLLEPLAEILGTLHDQGVVHGSVQGSALRLDPSGVTLSGFGMMDLASVLGGPGAIRDILPVRSRTPEQLGPVPASPSPESDTYSLAIIAVELLAGEPFTSAENLREDLQAIDDPTNQPTPRSLGIDVPDGVEKAFSKALATSPRGRTTDPRVFLQALVLGRSSSEKEEIPQHSEHPVPDPDPTDASKSDVGNGVGFEPPPKPTPPRRRSNFYPPPPPEPSRSKKIDWVVYVLIGFGLLLLVGGVIATFFYVLQAPPSPTTSTTSPPATTTLAVPLPTPLPTPLATPSPTPSPTPTIPTDAGDGAASNEAGAMEGGMPITKSLGGTSSYPEHATALIPIPSDAAIMGSRDALVTMVLFADMGCFYTRRARLAVERLMAQYGGELRVVVLHFPVSEYPASPLAAEAAAGVHALMGPQGFWSYFEKLTENQSDHSQDLLIQWAVDVGTKENQIQAALGARTYQRLVERDVEVARQLMVRGTPTFFVNGRRFDGMQTQQVLVDAIEAERVAVQAALSSGTKPAALYGKRVRFNVTSAAADRRPSPSPHP